MIKTIYILRLLCLMAAIVFAQNKPAGMTFVISGFENDDGQAVLNLYRSQDDIPEKPFKIWTTAIQQCQAKFTTDKIPFGDYAAIAYHDNNSNGVLDHKFFLPAEPMGFSNDWHLSIFSGMPTFEKLKFIYSADSVRINISVE